MINTRMMRILEDNAEEFGVSKEILMENAGNAVAEFVREKFDKRKIVVICGTGNNGGDGFVTARHLAHYGFTVSVILIGRSSQIRTPEASKNFHIIQQMISSIPIYELKNLDQLEKIKRIIEDSEIIIDAMLGTGLRGELAEPFRSVVNMINGLNKIVIAVDVPTGLNPDTGEIHGAAIKADYTITFHDIKPGLTNKKEYTGEVIIAGIGIPPEAELFIGKGDLKAAYPPRPSNAHKGDFGRVLVIGGSKLYSGAPTLASLAAYKAGVDLVFVITSKEISSVLRSYSPSLIVRDYDGPFLNEKAMKLIDEHIKSIDAVLLGPGLGLSDEIERVIKDLFLKLKEKSIPTVIDADGLKYLAKMKNEIFPWKNLIITPHRGEMRLFLNEGEKIPDNFNDQIRFIKEKAREFGITILLKSPIDIISDGNSVRANRTGNPSMTVGGTGDVLAGLTVGLLARGLSTIDAAGVAAYINGIAGDLAVKKYGPNIVSENLLEFIPCVIKGEF